MTHDDSEKPVRRSARLWIWLFLAVLVAGAAAVYTYVLFDMAARQNELIFEPEADRAGPGESGVFAAEAELIAEDGVRLNAWFRAPRQGAPAVVFLHGNRGALPDYAERINAYLNAGFGMVAVEYRGFGASGGEPSLEGILLDADAAYELLEARGVEPERIFVHGYSLGSYPATALAAEREVGGVVLEAPFGDFASMAAHRYPFLLAPLVRPLIDAPIDPSEAVTRVEEPVFVMHGTEDAIVPLSFGEGLHEAAANPGPFVRVEGGNHRTLLDLGAYDDAIAFIREAASQ